VKNDSPEIKGTEILLYDLTGTLILHYKHEFDPQEKLSIYTDNLSAGIYILHIETPDGLKKDKLVKY
jgi:hypothetical protein